ncbi:cation:proton antiporter [Corynebacterium neomassiliense]|uniref:cation:proton antiporter n=1 Tax=Corynebacterium neomassiliense TaxID=2079482 RepID=UPI00103231FE|nr:cation:proton antiporter [Corynebacterium neomassiliense]
MPLAAEVQEFIPSSALSVLFLQLVVILAAAVILGRVAARLSLPAVVGELTAGVVLGPSLLGAVFPDMFEMVFPSGTLHWNLLDAVGQLGVVLLVGLGTMGMDTYLLRRNAVKVCSVSSFSFAVPFVTGVGAGVGVWHLLDIDSNSGSTNVGLFAVFVGTAMSVSALPVIVKTLADLGLLHRSIGQLILMCGIANDAVGWMCLSVISSLAVTGAVSGSVSTVIAATIGAVVIVLVMLRPLVGRLLDQMESGSWRGSVGTTVVLLILLGAAVAQWMDLEASFGAFLAGLAIGPREERLMAPVQGFTGVVLAPVFLALAGLRMDLGELRDPAVLLAAAIVLAVAVISKFVGAYTGARIARLGRWEAVTLGAGLNSRGVVEVVIAMVGLQVGILTPATYTIIVLVAVVTSITAPAILKVTARRIPATC